MIFVGRKMVETQEKFMKRCKLIPCVGTWTWFGLEGVDLIFLRLGKKHLLSGVGLSQLSSSSAMKLRVASPPLTSRNKLPKEDRGPSFTCQWFFLPQHSSPQNVVSHWLHLMILVRFFWGLWIFHGSMGFFQKHEAQMSCYQDTLNPR